MKKIILDESKMLGFVKEEELMNWQRKVSEIDLNIRDKSGLGAEFLGWVDWPVDYDKEEWQKIKIMAQEIRSNSQVLVVIGIGGSYLGARAVAEALGGDKMVEICFAGNNLSSGQMNDLLKKIEGKEVSLNVISKSGTTIEPVLAFRILKKWMEDKYGQQANKRIYVTTDREKGVLKKIANEKKYPSLVVPDNIGGRFSILTAVGLLPIAVAGVEIEKLIEGAAVARVDLASENLKENCAYRYAVYRNILYGQGKKIEILANYEPRLHFLAEWWKQLFGESEGKEGKGIFPAAVDFTSDLHSMGQLIQEGEKNLMETVLVVEDGEEKIIIGVEENDEDGWNFLAGKSLEEVNKKAMEGVVMSHVEGGVPNLIIRLPKLEAFYLGYLIYFWQKAVAMSAYLLGVNPFNQPGVEVYKKNMFKLLGK